MTMMAAWMVYGLVVSGLLTAGAFLAERSAREAGRASRFAWVVALGGSLVVPVVAWLWPSGAVLTPAPVSVLRLQPIAAVANPVDAGIGLDEALLFAWLIGSLLIAVRLAFAAVRLHEVRRTWTEAEIDGEAVLLSADIGPAVVGIGRARIVMPRWVLDIDRDLRHLLLLHEREHMRAGDPRLLACALAALVCMPWNPFVWLQFLRLRLSIEIDCDARVLRASRNARGYGSLLLEVGRHRGGGAALAVAFGEPRRFLEDRIRMIPRALGPRRLVRAAGLAVTATAVLLLAVCARDPMSSVDPMDRPGVVESAQLPSTQTDISDAPRFTPFTTRPDLMNREEVAQALQDNYPPLLREAGIGGEALVWLFIDETGVVQNSAINRSSGYDALDQAALSVASTLRFTPAMNKDRNVPVWVAIPIVFSAADSVGQGQPRIRRPADASAGDAAEPRGIVALRRPADGMAASEPSAENGPSFTPFTDPPRLRNPEEILDLLARSYPPLLRDAGIGGEALVWFFIAANGAVEEVRINESSGYDALDQAALAVARRMEFAPAEDDGKRVPVWIAIPIVFSAK